MDQCLHSIREHQAPLQITDRLRNILSTAPNPVWPPRRPMLLIRPRFLKVLLPEAEIHPFQNLMKTILPFVPSHSLNNCRITDHLRNPEMGQSRESPWHDTDPVLRSLTDKYRRPHVPIAPA